MAKKKEEFEKIIEATPAFDKRDPDPSKNYGIGCVEFYFTLKGKLGAVTLHQFTSWHLPHVVAEFIARPIHDPVDIKVRFLPGPNEVVFHSPTPCYEGHTSSEKDCAYLGGTCYADIGYSIADSVFEALLTKGLDGLWGELERLYRESFEKTEAVDA